MYIYNTNTDFNDIEGLCEQSYTQVIFDAKFVFDQPKSPWTIRKHYLQQGLFCIRRYGRSSDYAVTMRCR